MDQFTKFGLMVLIQKKKGDQKYTYNQWYDLIRKIAPDAVIFGKGR